MNEAQVRHDLIDPALKAAGWESLPAKVTVEQTIAPGPVSQEDGLRGKWREMEERSNLLKQRYGSISEALSKLSFPTLDHALHYYSDIQHWLYAA